MPDSIAPRTLPDHLIAQGRYTIDLSEVERLLALDRASARNAIHRLVNDRRLFSPGRGLYVVVPPEYRSWGVVPADWFIEPLMKHLSRAYYVSMLTAAARHGASHQQPMIFQVMTAGRVLARNIERVHLRFYQNVRVNDVPTESVTVHTGSMQLATKETTVVDLITHPRAAGGLSNIATILTERTRRRSLRLTGARLCVGSVG